MVIGFTESHLNYERTLTEFFLKNNIDFNQGFFKDIEHFEKNNKKNGLFKNGIMFVKNVRKNNAFKNLFGFLDIDYDNVYWLDKELKYEVKIGDELTECTNSISSMVLTPSQTSTLSSSSEFERENKYFKIEYNQKKNLGPAYLSFWLNHKKDFECIEAYFESIQYSPKVKYGYYCFKPDQPILASCLRVPLEKAPELVTFLYRRQILSHQDLQQANNKITESYSKNTSFALSKLT